jgi:mRNA-degrading endonuclease RelE of RelBE toxin-antitoxin system
MSRPSRFILEGGALVGVTCRTNRSGPLPSPRQALDALSHGVLGRAWRLFSVQVCGVVPAAGHLRLLLWAEDAVELSRFLAFVASGETGEPADSGAEPVLVLRDDSAPDRLTGGASLAYSSAVWFVETSVFSGSLSKLLDDDGYRGLQQALALRPEQGSLIPGSGGLRKLRWALEGRGKRGGLRVIYYWDQEEGSIYLLYLYAKNRQEDLTQDQLKQLRRIIQEDFR